jgi:hypothetical protein
MRLRHWTQSARKAFDDAFLVAPRRRAAVTCVGR